jgi:hypothetical protein
VEQLLAPPQLLPLLLRQYSTERQWTIFPTVSLSRRYQKVSSRFFSRALYPPYIAVRSKTLLFADVFLSSGVRLTKDLAEALLPGKKIASVQV